MSEYKLSPIAAGIAEGLKEAIADANGLSPDGMKKTVVFPKEAIVAQN